MIAFLLAAALTLPEAPKPQPKHFDRTTWSLIAADASVRALDVYSTHQMIERGWKEQMLPKSIAGHAPAMAACSAATTIGNVMTARYLVRHGHPRLAKAILSVDVAQDGYWAAHNLTLRKLRPGEVVR
jgi:hypothetical protein